MTVPAHVPVDEEPRSRFFRITEWDSNHPRATPYPREWVESRWRPLADVLDHIRLQAGGPIRITPSGGYRNAEHNRALGGAAKSQHMEGRAADIVSDKLSARQLHDLILRLWEGGAIQGLSGLGKYDRFVHIDVGGPRPPGGIRRWTGGRKRS